MSLQEEVNAYFKQQKYGRYATPMMWVKALSLLVLCVLGYIYIVWGTLSPLVRITLVLGWGIVTLLIVFNIGHDAVHRAFSKRQWLNKLLGYSFNLVGANAYSWYLKHNQAHHLHTNISGKDHDVEMDPLMRVSPFEKHRWHYRWQNWYWPIVYSLFSILIIFVVDIVIMFQEKGQQGKHAWYEWGILILTKIAYLFTMFIVPVYWGGYSLNIVLITFVGMHLLNGLVIGLVFQPSHYFSQSTHFTKTTQHDGADWYMHQLASTVDISPQNKWLSQCIGSLNANVAHHLYPNISHVHYPQLANIIQQKAKEYDMPYHRKSFLGALKDHVRVLKSLSKK